MKIDLQGRVALVTGAAEGIGKGCAEALAACGADVIVNDINDVAGQATAEELRNLGTRSRFIQADVSDAQAVNHVIETIRAEFGQLHILVNNAGLTLFKTLAETTPDDWDKIIGLDLRGVYLMTRAALPLLKAAGETVNGASVVHVASVHAQLTVADATAYVAAKGGVVAMTRALCQELGGFGIRVNSISPGFVRTPHLERWLASEPDPEATLRKVHSYHPLGRIGTPADVGHLVAFLASEQASFITGTNITVDGGLTARLMH